MSDFGLRSRLDLRKLAFRIDIFALHACCVSSSFVIDG
jgi:hypothetical protein